MVKPRDLLLVRKFVRGIKASKRKIVSSKIFERAANLWPYMVCGKTFKHTSTISRWSELLKNQLKVTAGG